MSHFLVTGGASGIGAAAVDILRNTGMTVSVLDLYANPACDVADWNQVNRAIEAGVRRFGPLEGVIHCAGIDPVRKPLHELSPEEWKAIIDVNLTGTFHVCRAAIPHLMEGAAIAICGSVLGSAALEDVSAYSASKAGLHGLTRVLALELVARRIRVNLAEPAAVHTPMLHATLRATLGEAVDVEAYGSERRVGRPADPREVARILVWMASPESSPITGAIVPVDGGLTARLGLP